jgi:hypothetical protein
MGEIGRAPSIQHRALLSPEHGEPRLTLALERVIRHEHDAGKQSDRGGQEVSQEPRCVQVGRDQ